MTFGFSDRRSIDYGPWRRRPISVDCFARSMTPIDSLRGDQRTMNEIAKGTLYRFQAAPRSQAAARVQFQRRKLRASISSSPKRSADGRGCGTGLSAGPRNAETAEEPLPFQVVFSKNGVIIAQRPVTSQLAGQGSLRTFFRHFAITTKSQDLLGGDPLSALATAASAWLPAAFCPDHAATQMKSYAGRLSRPPQPCCRPEERRRQDSRHCRAPPPRLFGRSLPGCASS